MSDNNKNSKIMIFFEFISKYIFEMCMCVVIWFIIICGILATLKFGQYLFCDREYCGYYVKYYDPVYEVRRCIKYDIDNTVLTTTNYKEAMDFCIKLNSLKKLDNQIKKCKIKKGEENE